MGKRNKSNIEKIELIKSLRYASHEGQANLKRVLSYAAISRLTGIPCSTVRALCLRFEQARSDANHADSSAGAKRDEKDAYELQQVHVDFITAESTLKSWVSRSI